METAKKDSWDLENSFKMESQDALFYDPHSLPVFLLFNLCCTRFALQLTYKEYILNKFW